MTNYAQMFNPTQTPQTEKADPRQVPNSAGGFSFQVDKWQRLERFLILGSDQGSYYASAQKLTRENAQSVLACFDEDGPRAVSIIAQISDSGRAPKNDAAIFALALAASHSNPKTQQAAYGALPTVCRIGTHLFQFVDAVDKFRGWGRGLRRAVGSWYAGKTPDALAYQVIKYQNREKWSHRDVLRLAHLDPTGDAARDTLLRWIVAGKEALGEREVKRKDAEPSKYAAVGELPAFVAAFEELRSTKELGRVLALIREHNFTHEMVPGEWKAEAEVWDALSERMPLGALVRNLGKLTESGVIAPLSEKAKAVAARLTNGEQLKKARIHPIALLSALKVYQQGHGEKGKLTWSPVPAVVDALDTAFYEAFQFVQPTGKNTLLALDVSGSMNGPVIAGMPGITPRIGSAAMAMVTMRSEPNWHAVGFASGTGGYGGMHGGGDARLVDVAITPKQRLDDVIKTMEKVPMGGTDCSLPMRWALQQNAKIEAFVLYTDSETWHGPIHPHQALQQYRQQRVADAKLAVCGMVSNGFSIAVPGDAGMMDFVGFDTAAPVILADFIRGGAAAEKSAGSEDAVADSI